MMSDAFKKCSNCGVEWQTREDFIHDEEVILLGYQPNFVMLSKGLFLFNHKCGSTISVRVHFFADLYQGPMFDNSLTGSSECLGYCLHQNELRPCLAECECSYVRFVLGLLKSKTTVPLRDS